LHGYAFHVVATDGGPTPVSARHPETTVLVPVGATRDIELVADRPGDWAFHCHMTHHVMTQMGHDVPNLVGINDADIHSVDVAVRNAVKPSSMYMTMGNNGMGDMGAMKMTTPRNSIPMQPSPGPFSPIDMGGMFTVLKVRDVVDEHTAASWYQHPAGTVADVATSADLARDGITVE
jgi:hypothetical protein